MITQADTINLVPTELVKLKYDAVASTKRRRAVAISTRSEDWELIQRDRQSLSSQGRDLMRNFTLAGFAIRKHLQYVADFSFLSKIERWGKWKDVPAKTIDALNDLIEYKIARWSKPKHCDIARRHSLQELITLAETHRIVDGDVGIVKHASGHIQLIEGDRIRTPINATFKTPDDWVHGVRVSKWGEAYRYGVAKRTKSGSFEHEREISAENMILCGYYSRADQVRGVGLLAPAIIQFSQMYKGIDYALAKVKLSQLMGLFTTRKEDEDPTEEELEEIEKGDEEFRKRVVSKFGDDLLHIDGNEGDTAQLIESHTPSNEFQAFIEVVIRIAFAALDIPYSFFDGSKTNFFGSKGELNNYIDSCGKKQTKLIAVLEDLTDWKLRNWIADGEIVLPPGFTVEDISYRWQGAGIPYWKLVDDSKGYQHASMNGLVNPIDVAADHQQNFFENVDKIAIARDYARSKGLRLLFDVPYVEGEQSPVPNVGI